MRSALVSIIIPTRNEAKNIKLCLLSCQNQTHKNIEIIIVDNYSTDNTLNIARQATPNLFLKGNERSTQRNYGAKNARGNYLLFIDADMELTNNVITEAIRKAKGGRFIVAFPEKSVGVNFWEKSIALERNLYQKEKLLSAARFYPKELFAKLGGFDENLVAGEDWDLSLRAQNASYKLTFTKSHIIHHEHVTSFKEILAKKYYYSKNISLYVQKHPQDFAKKSSLKIRLGIFLKNWLKLSTSPHYAIGFILLKGIVWRRWQLKNGKLNKNIQNCKSHVRKNNSRH